MMLRGWHFYSEYGEQPTLRARLVSKLGRNVMEQAITRRCAHVLASEPLAREVNRSTSRLLN